MRIGLLGSVAVWRAADPGESDGSEPHDVRLGGVRLHGLLARLALDAERTVTVSALVDDLWGEAAPDGVGNALQSLVSRLRRALGADAVRTEPAGYRLMIAPRDVDAIEFGTLTAAARSAAVSDPEHARRLLGQAMRLWRGPALADVRDLPFATVAAERLEEQRVLAVEHAARLALDAGDALNELDALNSVLAGQPLRESTAALLARTLHAGGRQADALAVLERTRTRLVEQLGVDPGPEIVAAQLDVLRGQPGVPAGTPTGTATGAPTGAATGHADELGPGQPAGRPAAQPDGRHTGPPALPAHDDRPPTAQRNGLSSFVGRDDDVTRIRAALGASRLVTLTGPGGAGKTRLARVSTADVAALASARGRSEVRIAELAALGSPEELPAALLAAVGSPELLTEKINRVPDEPDYDTTERLLSAVAGRRLVLVLDNCEHLVDAAAKLAEAMLDGSPQLRILATSREPLGIPGELLHPVGALARDHAIQLFVDRARAVRPGFTLDESVMPAVIDICRRLDGQPLAIELAAARLRTLSAAEIAARLDDRFRLLTGGSRTALPRHQTLRAVVDWSWDLLTEPERVLLRRLGVFAGGATLEAVERVCAAEETAGGPAAQDVLELLAALVDKSLVEAVPQADGAPTRYRMLETIRAFASEKLHGSGDADGVAAAHARYFTELAETAEPHLRRADQLVWLATLRADMENLTSALRHTTQSGDTDCAVRLAASLTWFWMLRGMYEDAARWVGAALAMPGAGPAGPTALLTGFHAIMDAISGDLERAERRVSEVIAIAATVAPPRHPALELVEPLYAMFRNDDTGPVHALAERHRDGDQWVRAIALLMSAQGAENVGDLQTWRNNLREAHAVFRVVGDRWGLGMTVGALGQSEEVAGDHAAASAAYAEAAELAREISNTDDLPQFLALGARARMRTGDVEGARRLLDEAAEIALPGHTAGAVLLTLAALERQLGNMASAREHVMAARAEFANETFGVAQRIAVLASVEATVELDSGDLPAALARLAEAAQAARSAKDGPVAAAVAEVAAAMALVEGDAELAGRLFGVGIAQRGTLDRGNPDALATLDAIRTALGPVAADEAVERGRCAPKDEGLELLVGYALRR